jgi:hypothetical protein
MEPLTPEKAFDAEESTRDIVHRRVLPQLAKGSNMFKALAGALALAAALGASWATCKSSYQTRAAAKEYEEREAAQIETLRREAAEAKRDAAEVKAAQPYVQEELKAIRSQVDRLVDVLIDRPSKHGR